MYTADENMKYKTPLKSNLTLFIKNLKSQIFHSDKNKNGKQDREIHCMSLEKWLQFCDMPSSVIGKNELRPRQLTWPDIHHQYTVE